ncbi:hypothetical protein E3N88_41295 [Mikania micrantha]|uniref:Uncharacterized protein n=1 Tax=Mikania micrantha TaxID=192012 RepID=A0A5N6LSC4_9ASTR|nr:hypothetical protein E3N88_41295 [Mikania micrantha]
MISQSEQDDNLGGVARIAKKDWMEGSEATGKQKSTEDTGRRPGTCTTLGGLRAEVVGSKKGGPKDV